MTIIALAIICYEAEMEYSRSGGLQSPIKWSSTLDEVRDAYIQSVRYILGNQGCSPESVRDQYGETLRSHGWKYGQTFSNSMLTTPELAPFYKLKENAKLMPALRIAIVETLRSQVK